MKRVLAVALCLIALSGCAAKDTKTEEQSQPITIVSAIPQDVTMPPAINNDTPKADTKGVRLFGGEIPKPYDYPKGENPLFDEDKVLLLPIEGARYAVYDCYGNRVAECSAVSGYFGDITGLHNKSDNLNSEFSLLTLTSTYFVEDDVVIAYSPIAECWFSTDLRTGDMAVYDQNGEVMFTVKAQNPIAVNQSQLLKVGENYLLRSQRSAGYIYEGAEDERALAPSLYTSTGELVNSIDPENIRSLDYSFGDYFLVSYETDKTCIFNQFGSIIKEVQGFGWSNLDKWFSVYIKNEDDSPRYYTWGGSCSILSYYSNTDLETAYLDSELRNLTEEQYYQWAKSGASIPEVFPKNSTYTRLGWVSVDSEGSALKITAGDKSITVNKAFADEKVEDMNEFFVLLRSDSESCYRLIYLPTGEEKGRFVEEYDNADVNISYTFKLTKDRACFQKCEYTTGQAAKYSFQIFESDGSVGYQTDKNLLAPLTDELMILIRGPYLGIADYKGNWILKQPRPELARDTDTTYSFEQDFYLFYNAYNNTDYNTED